MQKTMLEGLDCLVFTGGIGEHAAKVRALICNRLRWLGLELDPKANDGGADLVSSGSSAIEIRVIATSEETTIARHVLAGTVPSTVSAAGLSAGCPSARFQRPSIQLDARIGDHDLPSRDRWRCKRYMRRDISAREPERSIWQAPREGLISVRCMTNRYMMKNAGPKIPCRQSRKNYPGTVTSGKAMSSVIAGLAVRG
jgi:hypothetical protein